MRTPVQLPAHRVSVGIDPSLAATGVCGVVDGQMKVSTVFTTEPTAHRPVRLIQQRDRLKDLLLASKGQLPGPEAKLVVGMEAEVWLGNPTQSGDAAAIQAVYQLLLWELDPRHEWLYFLPINTMWVKKWLGAKEKHEILLQVYKRYGQEFRDHNAADAFTLAMIADSYAAYIFDGAHWPEWKEAQWHVLKKLEAQGFPWLQAPVARGRGRKKLSPR